MTEGSVRERKGTRKNDSTKNNESKSEETKNEEIKNEETKNDGTKNEKTKNDNTKKEDDAEFKEPKFGPIPSFPNQHFWVRLILIIGALLVVYFTHNVAKVKILARQNELSFYNRHDVPCSHYYLEEIMHYLGEKEPVQCGRVVRDCIEEDDAEKLAEMAINGLSLTGEPAGGASILDLHSGALSAGENFINIYSLDVSDRFSNEYFSLYIRVQEKVRSEVAFAFGLPIEKLFLTKPTFFSRLTSKPPATVHDVYWRSHVDKETYESFHFTALLYLNDYGYDFKGGRFMFDDPLNSTTIVEPRTGRLLMFTSGAENYHHVERVTSGERLAITISFTCDEQQGIAPPSMSSFSSKR